MSAPLGTYTFLPWVRHGVANRIGAPSGSDLRAAFDVTIGAQGLNADGSKANRPVTQTIALYGPGDIIGIDPAQISRVEPQHWVTNFEPNYLAAIEFYDEDFPWRYTPAAPTGKRLLPWLSLIVLEEGVEFKDGSSVETRPLPFLELKVDPAEVFHEASEGWAWAHAHFNAAFSANVVEPDAALAAAKAHEIIASTPDIGCSRLLCPRRLKPKSGYHAFLVPSFESGRLAGLGIDPAKFFADVANALTPTSPAWGAYGTAANRPEPASYPYYHRWFFRTAEEGDFESLVRLLTPQAVDARVGQRDMDVTVPAPNVSGFTELNGILRLGGALRAPLRPGSEEEADYNRFERWDEPFPKAFQSELATFVNLADSYQAEGPAANADAGLSADVNADEDPLITPPIYGRWHALTERLLSERDGSDVPNRGNWVHDLNLDPRWRVAAGLGTGVIQANQESYMEAAWDQIGDVLEANRRIRQAQYAKFAGERLHARHVVRKAEVSPASLILLQAPVAARLISDGLTIQHRVRQSPLSTALASTALRRSIRPAGRLAQSLKLTEPAAAAALIERANAGIVTAAPPKGVPHDILTPDAIAAAAEKSASGSNALLLVLDRLIARSPLIAGVLALVLVVLAFLILGWIGLLLAFGALAAAWKAIRALRARQRSARRFREERLTPASVDEIPQSSSFTLVEIVDPRTASDIPASRPGGTDSAAAAAFKDALRDQYRLIGKSRAIGQVPERIPLDLARLARDAVTGLDPSVTVPRWIWSGIHLPERIRGQTGETFAEVMAYPEFDLPMYEPLAKAGDDLFVPNLHLVPPDSVTLLKTNQRFIEAYMVGLNHEFARELLWREYPTDQRGSYFRQFWDVRKKVAAAADKTAAREQLKDIKPIHRWPRASDLGDHDNRETGPVAEEELVLVIRGELLKKYPNTIVSAQRAKWRTKNGKPDKSRERELDESQPPMLPLYEARVPPDIYFFGFDLVEDEARGGDEVNDKPGWFFRIEEVPGDARFGFDIERASGQSINVWNDVAWADLAPGLAPNRPLHVAAIPAIALSEPAGEAAEKHEQWTSDRFVALADASAAELAYVALQTPVLMAVHAAELLPPDEEA